MKRLVAGLAGAFLALAGLGAVGAAVERRAVEPTDTVVEAMEAAFKAGYAAGVDAKQQACELGDLRPTRY